MPQVLRKGLELGGAFRPRSNLGESVTGGQFMNGSTTMAGAAGDLTLAVSILQKALDLLETSQAAFPPCVFVGPMTWRWSCGIRLRRNRTSGDDS